MYLVTYHSLCVHEALGLWELPPFRHYKRCHIQTSQSRIKENIKLQTHTDLKTLCCKFVILCFTLLAILRQGRLDTLNCDMLFVNFMERKFSAENYVDLKFS